MESAVVTASVKSCIDTLRMLAIDAVQKAGSGHPGTAMSMAPLAYMLWNKQLQFDPADPLWPNRDRFVLSCGHASMLMYSLLHVTETAAVEGLTVTERASVTLDDIKSFRQMDSCTPGHPEYGLNGGLEATTGPLGQGVAMSVGMAIAERWMATRYNRPGYPIVDYKIYSLCSDGDMMEGISGEAASLAGHLKLSNLCWIYDSNRISIEGPTTLAFTEDVGARFLAYGWNVLHVRDAENCEEIAAALAAFDGEQSRPTMIVVQSHIAFGSPNKQDTRDAHGEPLGEAEARLTKAYFSWPEDAHFLVPDGVYQHFRKGIGARGAALRRRWLEQFERYRADYPALASEFVELNRHELPENWESAIPTFPIDATGVASRDSSGTVLNKLAAAIPYLIGGAADLAPSTKTNMKFSGAGDFSPLDYSGRNMHFGIREHAMGAICNGMALSNMRAFGSGFLIFSDYMRGALRLSALMDLSVTWIFTHDSIGVGEDGPTHQPIEHLASLRAMPGLRTIRPCDANEVAEAWRVILSGKHHPHVLVLSRQKLPTLDRGKYGAAVGLSRGAYVLSDPVDRPPEVILIGTGSEVSLCISASELLANKGVAVRVVSMPCWELFEQQDLAYRNSVLLPDVLARVSVEQAAAFGWERYVGMTGTIIGMRSFGASAPMEALQRKFGFTVETVVEAALEQYDQTRCTRALDLKQDEQIQV